MPPSFAAVLSKVTVYWHPAFCADCSIMQSAKSALDLSKMLTAAITVSAFSTDSSRVPHSIFRIVTTLSLARAVATLHYPNKFDQRNDGDESRIRNGKFTKDFAREGRLVCVILCKVSSQNVGIQANHLAFAPCSAIALFISSIETGRGGFRRMPFRARTGVFAATMAYCPFPISINSIRLPVSKPRAARTAGGIVTCPFAVTVAVAIKIPSFLRFLH
jgi:hypothetical protein